MANPTLPPEGNGPHDGQPTVPATPDVPVAPVASVSSNAKTHAPHDTPMDAVQSAPDPERPAETGTLSPSSEALEEGPAPRAVAIVLAFIGTVLAQFIAVMVLRFHPWRMDPFAQYFLWQSLAGAVEAILIRQCLPLAYRAPRRPALLLLWLVCTLLPLFGGLLILFACAWAKWFPARPFSRQIGFVPRPTFVSNLVSQVSHGGGARLQARVSNVAVPAQDRLSALVAIQQMPTRTTSPLLRDLLTDPLEDVRLIAYGRMDQAENEIMQKIFVARNQLSLAGTDQQLQGLHRLLAELYFELAYQNIVQGAVQTHALEQADQHAQAALQIGGEDPALWLKRGRLALIKGQADAAQHAFEQARALGFPADNLAPWLAEVAFLRGDYRAVASLVRPLQRRNSLPVLKPVVEYWST